MRWVGEWFHQSGDLTERATAAEGPADRPYRAFVANTFRPFVWIRGFVLRQPVAPKAFGAPTNSEGRSRQECRSYELGNAANGTCMQQFMAGVTSAKTPQMALTSSRPVQVRTSDSGIG